MTPTGTAEYRHLGAGLVLAPVWVSLGLVVLALRGAGMGAAVALTVLGTLQLVFGGWVFWTHGGRQITAAGVYSISASIFVGFAAIYYSALYGSDVPHLLYPATVLCYFSHVVLYLLFWRTSYPGERARGHATERVIAWTGKTGLVLLVTALAAHLAGIEIVFVDATAFVSLVFLVCAAFHHPGGPAGRPWYLFAAVTGFVVYTTVFFSGYGRLKLATLGIAFAAAACRYLPHRSAKLLTLAAIPGALLVFGAMRVAFFQQLYPGTADTEDHGIGSVILPLLTFGQVIEGINGGTIDYGHGSTFVATFFLYVPRIWWEGKPIGFGSVLTDLLLKKGTYTEGTSLSALSLGEWYYDFGILGIPLMVVVFGLAIRWLDRVLHRVVERPLSTRNDAIARIAALVAASGMSDLMWVGTFTFNERGGARLVVILAVALVCTDVLWRRVRALPAPGRADPLSVGSRRVPRSPSPRHRRVTRSRHRSASWAAGPDRAT
ncbi:MAG: O-antigen polymerase [Pseudonocardiaceae bacterium]